MVPKRGTISSGAIMNLSYLNVSYFPLEPLASFKKLANL